MNGVIVIDKPSDFTSFDVVAVMRRLSGQRKIGHTGTLDPMATGVLPLLLGRATRAASLLEDADKIYEAEFLLGVQTDTQDSTGKVLAECDRPVSRVQLLDALPAFRGDILQTPPMYSAVSKDGKRLYELARKGIEVEREARPITIYQLDLLEYRKEERRGTLRVSCSKGTYIRTLCEDLGRALGTYGILTALRRTAACGFSLEQAITLPQAKALSEAGTLAAQLQPIDGLFPSSPKLTVTAPQSLRFQNGGALALNRLSAASEAWGDGQQVRVYSPEQEFLGLGQVDLDKKELAVRKLFCAPISG